MTASESIRDVGQVEVVAVEPGDVDSVVDGLADVLVDCVAGGASIGFLAPLDIDAARQFWRDALRDRRPSTWIARDDADRIVGVVRLVPSAYPNGGHRAEVVKLMVRRDARGRGVAELLMQRLEEAARDSGRWLLVLDTQTGSPAERLYERWGWRRFGVLEDHALTPDGVLAPTSYLFKRLSDT